jgi:hypothetical protein
MKFDKDSLKRRLSKINDATLKRPYAIYFVIIFFAYIGLNLWINKIYVNLPTLTSYATWFLIPFLIFNFFLVPALVALTMNLSIVKFKELKEVQGEGSKKGKGKAGSFAALGVFGGVLGGACPGCFVGLFPAVLGLFGVTASLSILPLFGLEIQILSTVLLGVSIFYLTRDTVCKVSLDD